MESLYDLNSKQENLSSRTGRKMLIMIFDYIPKLLKALLKLAGVEPPGWLPRLPIFEPMEFERSQTGQQDQDHPMNFTSGSKFVTNLDALQEKMKTCGNSPNINSTEEVTRAPGDVQTMATSKPETSVIIVRHGERLDQVDGRWVDDCIVGGEYIPKDDGDIYPLVLPWRLNMEDYRLDPPLTSRGQQAAMALGSRLRHLERKITSIYVSPMNRCMETARRIAEGAGLLDLEMKIEPGFLEWAVANGCKTPPLFSDHELALAGFNVSKDYKPSMLASEINARETTRDFSKRSEMTLQYCLRDHEQTASDGTMLVVTHQLTVITLPISLQENRISNSLELLLQARTWPCLGHVQMTSGRDGWWMELMPFADEGDKVKYEEIYRQTNRRLRWMGCKYWGAVVCVALNAVFTRFPSLLGSLAKSRNCWEGLTFEEE